MMDTTDAQVTHYMRPRFVRYASQEAEATVRMDCGVDGMLLVMWDEDQEPGLSVQYGQIERIAGVRLHMTASREGKR